MWYASFMPQTPLQDAIDNAASAVAYAQQVRKYHARRRDRRSKQRVADIELALTRLKEAMAPIRSEIGRFPMQPQTDVAERRRQEVRDASAAIQRERRKLWKMQKTKSSGETK